MCVLGCGRLGWAALVPGHRAVVGIYARSPVTDIVLLSTRTHIYISTYLQSYISTELHSVFTRNEEGVDLCAHCLQGPANLGPSHRASQSKCGHKSWESTLAKFEKFKTLRILVPSSSSGHTWGSRKLGQAGDGWNIPGVLPPPAQPAQPSPAQPSQS